MMRPGDIIDVIAPSGSFEADAVQKMAQYIESKGYIARIPEGILGEDLFSSHTEIQRAACLKSALLSEDSSVIWCVRGGYGATPLLPHLTDLAPPKKKKTLIGFSDITALHLFCHQNWSWNTIHGPMLRQMALKAVAEPSFLQMESLIFSGLSQPSSATPQIMLDYTLCPLNQNAQQQKTLEGDLTGGNLTLVQCSLGTSWQIQTHRKILMLEDIAELAYRSNRSLHHLYQAGIFSSIQALVLGDFTFHDPQETLKIDRMLAEFSASLPFPVYRLKGMGHGEDNLPWIYGPARIDHNQLQQNPSVLLKPTS